MTDSHASVAVEPPPPEPRHEPFRAPSAAVPPSRTPAPPTTPAAAPSSPSPNNPTPEPAQFSAPSDAQPRKQLSASSARRSPTVPEPVPSAPPKSNGRRPARPPSRRTHAPLATPVSSKSTAANAARRDTVTGKYHRHAAPPSTTATSFGRPDPPQPSMPSVGKPEPTLIPDNGDATSVLGSSREQPAPAAPVPTGTLDEYREGCLKLEKIRHGKVFEAEKRRLFHESSVETEYQRNVHAAVDEYLRLRTKIVMRLLSDNLCKVKHVQGLRFKIMGEDSTASGWNQRKHEMSLRGRGATTENNGDNSNGKSGGRSALEEDGLLAEIEKDNGVREKEKKGRNRKNENRQKVKVQIEVEESEALHDLALIRGEKRSREPEPVVIERRVKKRK